MNNTIRYLIFFLFLSFIGCSGVGNGDSPEITEPVWDKTRTVKVTFLSDLTGNNPFTVSGYPTLAAWIKKDESHLLILDKANVRYTQPRHHTGAKLAVQAERFPIFVPVSETSDSYIGSTLLFRKTVTQMELTPVNDVCRFMQTTVEIKPGLSVNTNVASFNQSDQVTAALPLLKKAVEQSVLVTGSIKREDMAVLRSALSTTFPANSYELTIAENSHATSNYCIFILGSKKWKFRKLTETGIQNALKSFLLEVEYLK
ncbi:MAG: hypothetical protein LLF81_08910 [Porphyromonadaceae bacterium]|nr:hypothetical protein [Porphyromonadaceae bacterium]